MINNEKSQPTAARRIPFASLLIAFAAWVIQAVPGLGAHLYFDRLAIEQGEFWRLVTCQWTHWSWSHFAWDVLALVTLGAACEMICRARFLSCVAASALIIPLGVWRCEPQVMLFGGLSGIASALYLLLAVELLRKTLRKRDFLAAGAIGALVQGFFAKVLAEAAAGETLFSGGDGALIPLTLAHWIGAAIGFASGFLRNDPIKKASTTAFRGKIEDCTPSSHRAESS